MKKVANHKFTNCPRCARKLAPAMAINNAPSEFWLRCTDQTCRTFVNTYIPQPHQAAFHADDHRITANFGGYGSGKTTTTRMEMEKHILITDGGTSLVGANVTSQYEQTLQREFNADFPKELVAHYNTQKSFVDFDNGHRLIYRPYDDPNKLRSYNLTSWVILEASEVKEESFTQLKTRLRNTNACTFQKDADDEIIFAEDPNGSLVPVIDKDWRRGIIESNPSAGWIKTSVLNCSDEIYKHGDIHDVYTLDKEEQDRMISTHVTATTANAYLPPDFIEMQTKNRPRWWAERYIYGSFLYADGLVYPSATKYICDPFEIPKAWRRIVAFDYGLADSSCFLFGAVDMMNNLLYFYKEVYVNNRNVAELANLFKEAAADIPVGNWICSPIIDPKSGPRRDYDKKTLADNFLDYGISFIPGQVNREARVFRLNTYLESGRVRIMATCPNLIRQLKGLKFKQDPISTTNPWRNDPEDKDDHAVVCAEWIVMELPKNPKDMLWGVYGKDGNMIDLFYNQKQQRDQMDDRYGYHVFDDTDIGQPTSSNFDDLLYFERDGYR